MRELRDDQKNVIEKLRAALRHGHKRVIMQAPTGFGKTLVASALVDSALSKQKRIIFTIPVVDLIPQTLDMFGSFGIHEVGVIQAQHEMTNWNMPVQIASVATLQNRTIPDADLVIMDEIHKWWGFYAKWMLNPAWEKVPFIGLSATPWTKGLGAYFQELIIATTTQELIDNGRLSPFRVFSPSHPDLHDVRIVAGDYHEGDLAEVMGRRVLVADIVQTWLSKAKGLPTLCFAVNRDHARSLQEQFEAAGVKTAYQDANTKMDERAAIKRGFHDGSIEVVVNIGTLTTGIDWDVRCISLCRPTKSEMLFVQIIGRGLRTAEGKSECLILDHSDNHLRLGFVTDIDANNVELDDGRPKPKKDAAEQQIKLPKECPSCGYLKPPRMAKCLNCGFIAEKHARDEAIEVKAGELRELKKANKRQYTIEEKAVFLSELKAHGQNQGYKDGWAVNKYREKFGVEPSSHNLSLGRIEPASVITEETKRWITSQNIRWAHSRKNNRNQVSVV